MIINPTDPDGHNQFQQFSISFIIPCLNEERNIGRLIQSLRNEVKNINYELIIVDNGSTDETIEIVKKSSVKLIIDSTKTIGGLRNIGAESASGEYLVFLDADILLTKAWNDEIPSVLEKLKTSPMITGSRCSISLSPGFIEKYWFEPMAIESRSNYMNSAHLIIKKEDFLKIGGFSSCLVTAEDYEFCQRAREMGFQIVNNPKLVAIHEGYPKTILDFIRRERWHGSQDVNSFGEFFRSKVAVFSVLYCSALSTGFLFLIIFKSFYLFFGFIGFSFFLCLAAAIEKRRRYQLNIPVTFVIFNIYFFARALSLFDKFVRKSSIRWSR